VNAVQISLHILLCIFCCDYEVGSPTMGTGLEVNETSGKTTARPVHYSPTSIEGEHIQPINNSRLWGCLVKKMGTNYRKMVLDEHCATIHLTCFTKTIKKLFQYFFYTKFPRNQIHPEINKTIKKHIHNFQFWKCWNKSNSFRNYQHFIRCIPYHTKP